jgi:amino acid transporter
MKWRSDQSSRKLLAAGCEREHNANVLKEQACMDVFLIYLLCFGVGLLFTLISAVMGEVFGGHGLDTHADVGTGGHAEAGFDHTGVPGLSMFSTTVIAAFLTAFGGFGMIFSKIHATSSPWLSAPLALLSGGVVAGGVFVIFNYVFSRTQSSSEGHVSTLVGVEATVISAIPQHGVGEIAYVQAGSRYTAPARSESGASVGNGQTVRINRIVGTQFYVAPV